jgi:hypothetical protein
MALGKKKKQQKKFAHRHCFSGKSGIILRAPF